MARWASYLATAIFALVLAFQVALVLGAPWGGLTQGGGTEGVLPAAGRVLAGVSAIVVVVFWLGVSGRAGWGPWRGRRKAGGLVTWVAVGYSSIGLIMNALSRSAVERNLWVPVIAVLLACCLAVALERKQPQGTT